VSRGIFLINDKDELVELREQPYDTEDRLQRYLELHPNLLAGDQMDDSDPRRWLFVAREVGVRSESGSAGRLDHLFLDQDAIPTLVEVKRSSDTRIRREVVGQMLDYAANAVVYWPVEHLIEQFGASCHSRNADPDREIESFLGPNADPASFWAQVKTNLQAGKIRMLFVSDVIPPELRRIVEFLNQQMDPAEVLAVEIKQFAGEGLRTLVPRVIGQSAEAEQKKKPAGERRQWDEASFFQELARRRDDAGAAVARRILAWATEHRLRVWWGKGQQEGAFVPVLDLPSASHQPFAVRSTGSVEIYFYWYTYKPPFSDERRRAEILHRLNEIPGVAIPESALNKRPSIPMSVLAREGNVKRFLAVFGWYLDEVRAAESAPSTPDFPTDS
jgi:hypothetical protein